MLLLYACQEVEDRADQDDKKRRLQMLFTGSIFSGVYCYPGLDYSFFITSTSS